MMRALALCVLALVATLPPAAGAFVAFETGPVRPLALSPDGPMCTKGRLGPMTPYLPSGAWL